MLAHDTLPETDLTGTPDVPSAEAELPVARKNTLAEWADFAVRTVVGHPGIVLLGVATTGFVVGSVVKRLLGNKTGDKHEGNPARK